MQAFGKIPLIGSEEMRYNPFPVCLNSQTAQNIELCTHVKILVMVHRTKVRDACSVSVPGVL